MEQLFLVIYKLKMNHAPVTHKVGEENEQRIKNNRNYFWQFYFLANVIVEPLEVANETREVRGTQFNATALVHSLK